MMTKKRQYPAVSALVIGLLFTQMMGISGCGSDPGTQGTPGATPPPAGTTGTGAGTIGGACFTGSQQTLDFSYSSIQIRSVFNNLQPSLTLLGGSIPTANSGSFQGQTIGDVTVTGIGALPLTPDSFMGSGLPLLAGMSPESGTTIVFNSTTDSTSQGVTTLSGNGQLTLSSASIQLLFHQPSVNNLCVNRIAFNLPVSGNTIVPGAGSSYIYLYWTEPLAGAQTYQSLPF